MTNNWPPISHMFLRSARVRSARFENYLEQNSQLLETSPLNWNANSRRRKDAEPFGLQPMSPRWRLCTTQHNGSKHAWKPPICSKGDSRTALWMNPKRNIQRPRMLANVGRLPERREAHASHSW